MVPPQTWPHLVIRARDLLRKDVETVSPDTSLREAAGIIREKGVGSVLVAETAGVPLGILTAGDILRAVGFEIPFLIDQAELDYEGAVDAFERAKLREVLSRPVRDFMTRKLVTVTPETTLENIAHLLQSRRINQAPVIENGVVVGIVGRAEILRALSSAQA